MTTPLRVLIVDDSDSDAQRTAQELRRLPHTLTVEYVHDHAALSTALATTRFDLILADCAAFGGGCGPTLALCRDAQPRAPVLVVSRDGDEASIVDALHSGARDYVHKDRLGRLLPIALRELRRERAEALRPLRSEHESGAENVLQISQRAEQAWQRSEAQMRELLESGLAGGIADPPRPAGESKRWLKLAPVQEPAFKHAQKLEAVGRLAGAVAHDFNNLMSIVVTYSSLLALELPKDSPLQSDLGEIKHAGERATALTRQLLAFTQKPSAQPVLVDLNRVLEGMARMLRSLLGDGVELSLVTDPSLATTVADPHQIEQLLLNLTVNARDAMRDGGRLVIETANVTFSESYAADHPGARAGAHVMIAVTDTGAGMDEATQARLFEPFFSTKPVGQGIGLGLATVLGIVQQCEGSLWVDSTEGEGSTFRVYLPVASERSLARPSLRPSRLPRAEDAGLRGSETVLLVEDDVHVRASTRAILKRLGYRVLEARDSDEALSAVDGREIDVLLTNVSLPRVSGVALADQLIARHPRTKVLYMSSQPDAALLERSSLRAGSDVLDKPVAPDALARKLRKLLG